MNGFHGNEDEMGIMDHGLSIEEADDLLAGHVPVGRGDLAVLATDLASLSAAFCHDVDTVDIRLWSAQAAAHARLIPSDKGDLAATSASNVHRPAPQVSVLPKRRIPVLSSIAAFIATTVGKTVVAGALVATTATGGLAAAGNLPGQSSGPDPVVTVIDADPCAGLEDAAEDACETAAEAAEEAADAAEEAADAAEEAAKAAAKVEAAKVQAAEVETDEVDTDEVDTNEVDTDEVETDEVETDEVDTDEVETDEVDTDEVDTDEVETDEVDTDEDEDDADEVG